MIFGGIIKQLDLVDIQNYIIMDYFIFDAIKVGVTRWFVSAESSRWAFRSPYKARGDCAVVLAEISYGSYFIIDDHILYVYGGYMKEQG